MMILRTPLILATLGVFTLAACDPMPQGNPDSQRTRTGAATGALIGGALGATTGDGNKLGRAAVGAGLGALIGGAIGAGLDKQAADLRNSTSGNIGVVNTGDALVVTMPQDLLFSTDSANVRPDLQADLRAVAANLQQYPESRVEVIGHTDNTGAAGYNQDLSTRRAGAVVGVLRNAGVPSSRLVAIGRGEDQPIASNLTAEGRAQNRRVEIIIRPYN
ncbi:MAG: OmpA family protein [Gemmobacter sp.]|nr:OmpA family protein [Gemmobacter sp.]